MTVVGMETEEETETGNATPVGAPATVMVAVVVGMEAADATTIHRGALSASMKMLAAAITMILGNSGDIDGIAGYQYRLVRYHPNPVLSSGFYSFTLPHSTASLLVFQQG